MTTSAFPRRGWGRAARRGGAAIALFGSLLASGCRLFDLDVEKCGPEFRDVIVGSEIRDANEALLGGMELRLREERNPTVHRFLWVVVSTQGMFGAPLRDNIESIKLFDTSTLPYVELFTLPLDGGLGGDEVIPTQQILYPDFIPFEDFKNLMLTDKVAAEFRTTVQGSELFVVPLALKFETDWDREICRVV